MRDIAYKDILSAIERIKLPSFDLVVGIGSGGVVPAVLVSGKLECDLRIIDFKYRDQENRPAYPHPMRQSALKLPDNAKKILLVDDVCVSGETLRAAKAVIPNKGFMVRTMVFKGKADYVLFPKLKECVRWPWKT